MTHILRKLQAKNLRQQGYSYNMIVDKIGVAKSTVSDWVRDIPYSPNAQVIKRIGIARAKSGEAKSRIKNNSILLAKESAMRKLGKLSSRDIFMAGLGVYIGEGSKTGGLVRIVNSDPAVIKYSIRWFRESFDLKMPNFCLKLHLYPDNNIRKSILFWSKETGIPINQFYKVYVDRRTDKKAKKKGKSLHGTAQLGIRSYGDPLKGIFLSREIEALMDKILE